MELIVFTGLQASGKTTYYARHLLHTHLRLSLDQFNASRHRESVLLAAALESKTPTVVDNTNAAAAERARYVVPAKAAGFRAVSYLFESTLEDCLARNAARDGARRVPDVGLRGCLRRLEPPTLAEGFDALVRVRIAPDGSFIVEPAGATDAPRPTTESRP